eukprot:m.10313 g.10313  ORF g.10313 m.10313 type:complete len:75 (+) comp3651_c0_seq1:387-611(+)
MEYTKEVGPNGLMVTLRRPRFTPYLCKMKGNELPHARSNQEHEIVHSQPYFSEKHGNCGWVFKVSIRSVCHLIS